MHAKKKFINSENSLVSEESINSTPKSKYIQTDHLCA